MDQIFYQAGSFLDDSPVSDLNFACQVPRYKCNACGQRNITSWLNYPQVDATKMLTKSEILRMGPVVKTKASDDELVAIIDKLRRELGVFITAGTIFGPTQLRVTSKPKMDFYVLVGHAGLFCKKLAAEKLREIGFGIDFVKTPANGKYALEADYVEFVIPVMGRQALPSDKSFCNICFRYSPGASFKTVLLREDIPTGMPFFKTLDGGTIVFTSDFISEIRKLGIAGFVEGKTLIAIATAEQQASS